MTVSKPSISHDVAFIGGVLTAIDLNNEASFEPSNSDATIHSLFIHRGVWNSWWNDRRETD